MLNVREVLGFSFVNNTMDELVMELQNRIAQSQKTFIVTANPEIITYAQSNKYYEDILKNSDYIIPDGVGIILASKILGRPLQERLTGFDLMTRLLSLSTQKQYNVYLLGTEPHIIDLSAENIKMAFPHINIVGFHHGYFHTDEEIICDIQEKKPDMVFVGLGFPKQEKWISDNLHHFDKGVFIGIGGCLNIWAGVNKRAPKVMRDLNLEWLYRLVKEPSRSKRMLAIPIFLKRIFRHEYK
ncbi:WecB/TagA/CpsF family glycosyltransferase [Neobacillus jeddahensis]|uniref:WecB/TagA/CpsF family glycosyltransferase n=1 Tax=Neobacillus jeddahensis TaxID=1461580 RepID=UPI00058C7B8C|nr:WecB/TagA/CpsF family glycosyltransferase [Neobacillus jeddahensis]